MDLQQLDRVCVTHEYVLGVYASSCLSCPHWCAKTIWCGAMRCGPVHTQVCSRLYVYVKLATGNQQTYEHSAGSSIFALHTVTSCHNTKFLITQHH